MQNKALEWEVLSNYDFNFVNRLKISDPKNL